MKMAAAEAVRRRVVAWEALGHGCELETAKERRGEGGTTTAGECESRSAPGRVIYRPRRACHRVYAWRAREGEGRASSGLHCAAREASMVQADRRGSARQLWH